MSCAREQIETTLIAPLDALWGGTRPKGMSAKAMKEGRARLVAELRYLDEGALSVVAHEAQGLALAVKSWPLPGMIVQRAHMLYPNPEIMAARDAGIARFMRCQVGRAALDGGYHVELLAALRAQGPGGVQPAKITIDRWKEAAARRDWHTKIAKRDDDTDAMAFYAAREAEARAMVIASNASEAPRNPATPSTNLTAANASAHSAIPNGNAGKPTIESQHNPLQTEPQS